MAELNRKESRDPLDSDSIDPLDSNSLSVLLDPRIGFEGIANDTVQRVQTEEFETQERKKKEQQQKEEEEQNQLQKSKSLNANTPEAPQQKKALTLKERYHEYWNAVPAFSIAYLQVFCIYLGVLSIYWGSIFKRETRYENVKYLVVIEDSEFNYNGNIIQPYLGNAMFNMIANNKTIDGLGDFDIVNITEFERFAASHNNTSFQEVKRQVHHQKYWGAIYVAPESTERIYDSFYTANATFMSSGAINETVVLVYETGRHFSALSQYILKNLNAISESWIRNYVSSEIYQPIIALLNETQREQLLSSNETIAIFTTFPTFSFDDQRPVSDAAVLAPSEVQLIYALLVSFYSFIFSLEIYAYMKKRIIYRSYLFYKFLITQLYAFVLGLVYSLMVKAFRISTSETFGKLGFLVLWMFIYLFISAAGVVNEVVVLIFLAYDKKQLIAPWMVFNIVSNVSPTFAPFVLLPGFYRYGYAVPMYNAYEALKVVFFNTWKGHLGRNIGILIVWIVVGNIVLMFVTAWANRRAKRIAKEQRRKEKEALQKEAVQK